MAELRRANDIFCKIRSEKVFLLSIEQYCGCPFTPRWTSNMLYQNNMYTRRKIVGVILLDSVNFFLLLLFSISYYHNQQFFEIIFNLTI